MSNCVVWAKQFIFTACITVTHYSQNPAGVPQLISGFWCSFHKCATLKSSNKATAHWEFLICLLLCHFFSFLFTFRFLHFSLASLSNQLFFFWTNTWVLSGYKNPTKLKDRWNKKDAYKERIKATFMVCGYKWIHQMDKNLKRMRCFSWLQSVYGELILDCCLIISTDSMIRSFMWKS